MSPSARPSRRCAGSSSRVRPNARASLPTPRASRGQAPTRLRPANLRRPLRKAGRRAGGEGFGRELDLVFEFRARPLVAFADVCPTMFHTLARLPLSLHQQATPHQPQQARWSTMAQSYRRLPSCLPMVTCNLVTASATRRHHRRSNPAIPLPGVSRSGAWCVALWRHCDHSQISCRKSEVGGTKGRRRGSADR